MLKITRILLSSVVLVSLLSSCSAYQKVLNNPNVSEKYTAAQDYYNTGDYRRANRLFEQILPSYRGKPQAQRVIFFYANSYFQIKDYYLAAYQFESFIKSYPKSDRIDQANFMEAKCYYMLSPKFSLDQKNTNEAIDKLQQYYTIRDYKAAIKAFDNFIISYPGTPFREDALYYKFLSSYEIATNSVFTKKLERLKGLNSIYKTILRYYPETLYLEDIDDKMKRVDKEINLLDTTPIATTK